MAELAEFARRALRLELWPHQLAAAESEAFITVIAKARRTGGTVLAESLAAYTAFTHRGCRVLVLSATQDAARRVTESIAARLARSPLASARQAVVDDFATRIRLENGSEVVSLPASQRQVRGYGEGVRLVILDEAGFMPGELWTAAHYTALDERSNGSRVLMLGTPWGGAEHFFRRAFVAGSDGDPDHASHHWKYDLNPALDHRYLERQRERVSPAEYSAEVLGEWSDAAGALFPRALLERQVADLELPRLHELHGPAPAAIGIDYGVSFDRSAAVVAWRLPVASLNPELERLPRFVLRPSVWPQGHQLSAVVGEIAAARARFEWVSTETSGVGAMPSQELRRLLSGELAPRAWNLVATTNPKKTAGYGALLALLERGQLVLPRDPTLLRQLAGLRFEQGERGFTRIEAELPAVHDDVADAAMLCAGPHVRHGRIACELLRVALGKRVPPDPELTGAGDVVETAGGLRVWRRPALLGVRGEGLRLPPGFEPKPQNRFQIVRAA